MDKSPNHRRGASPQAYSKLLRQSRPAEIIAAARAFINQSPSRPHTPNVHIRQSLPTTLPATSRKPAQSSPKSRSISAIAKKPNPTNPGSRSALDETVTTSSHDELVTNSIQDEIVTILNGVQSSHDVEGKAERLIALAESSGCQLDNLLQPISVAVVSLHESSRSTQQPDDALIALSRIFFEVVESCCHSPKPIPYLAAICGVLLQVSECEANDSVFAEERFIHCFVKLLATYQQNIPGNVENTILNCLKNVTLNHENQVACGELKLVDVLVARISSVLTNPATTTFGRTKNSLLTLSFAVLRNLATNKANKKHFSSKVMSRIVQWMASVHDQPKQLLHCARILAKLAMYPVGLDRIEKAIAIPELLRVVEEASINEDALLVRTLFVLGKLAATNASSRIEIGTPRIVMRICEILHDPRTSRSLSTASSRLLANLTLEPEVCTTVPPDVNAIYDLLGSTDKEPKNKELLLNLVASVTNLSYYWNTKPPDNIDMNKWQERAIHPILPLLFMGDAALLNEGLYALSNLSTNKNLQSRLSDLLVDEAAIILLGYEDLEIARVACGILTNMAGCNQTIRRMEENMAASVIIKRIRNVSLSCPQYVTTGCQTLFNYLHFHPNELEAMCQSDVRMLHSTLAELLAVAAEEARDEWNEFVEVGNHILQRLREWDTSNMDDSKRCT